MKKRFQAILIMLLLISHMVSAAASMTTETKGGLYEDTILELEEKLALWENMESDIETRELERMRDVFSKLFGASAPYSKGFSQYIEVLIDIAYESYDSIDDRLFQLNENLVFCNHLETVHQQYIHIGDIEQLNNYAEGRKKQYRGEEAANSMQEKLQYFQEAMEAYDLCDGWLDSAKRYLDIKGFVDEFATPEPTPAPVPTPTPIPPKAAELGLSVHPVSEGYVEITDYYGYEPELVIPERLYEGVVVSIGKQAFDSKRPNNSHPTVITSIVLPDTVRTIGDSAFSNCVLLKTVKLPKYLTTIGADAFSYCTSVKEFILPEYLTRIEQNTFDHCTSLEKIIIPESVTRIGAVAFCNCTRLTEVQMSSNVTFIDNYAFKKCFSLEKINLPFGLETIGTGAFLDCKKLIVTVPASATDIRDQAFKGCLGVIYEGKKP